jgi:hypothetical protein
MPESRNSKRTYFRFHLNHKLNRPSLIEKIDTATVSMIMFPDPIIGESFTSVSQQPTAIIEFESGFCGDLADQPAMLSLKVFITGCFVKPGQHGFAIIISIVW